MQIDKDEIKKILCIKPRGIGDIILSTIVLDNLKSYFTSATIDYMTEHFAMPSLQNNPMINKIISADRKEFVLKTIFKIRKENYDLILDMWSNPRTAQLTYFSKAKYRVGFAYQGRKYAYNILGTSERGDHHSAEHNLELLKPLEIPITSKNIHYYVSDDEKVFADNYFQKNFNANEKIIGIIPAGGWSSKRCDASKWVEICREILKKYKVKFLILWGPGDEDDTYFIQEQLNEDAVTIPSLSLRKMCALFNICNVIIANDSGPMHISAAMGKPTLGIFGPTDPKKHGPYSPNSTYVIKEDLFCIVCNKLICPYNHECMLQLPLEKVMDKFTELLELKTD